jgi:hypothetical protein
MTALRLKDVEESPKLAVDWTPLLEGLASNFHATIPNQGYSRKTLDL